jgi:hypothetical protein
VAYSSRVAERPAVVADLTEADALSPFVAGGSGVVQHSTRARAGDGAIWKYVSVAGGDGPRIVQVGLPIADDSPVSPRFGEARPL